MNQPHIIFYSVENRANPTAAESVLFTELRRGKLAGSKWKRQVPIGNYIVDFLCNNYPLVVELDGNHHRFNNQQHTYDEKRDEYLRRRGYTVLRFENAKIFSSMPAVLEKIKITLCDMGFIPQPIVFRRKKIIKHRPKKLAKLLASLDSDLNIKEIF